jgi:hypothetical protein
MNFGTRGTLKQLNHMPKAKVERDYQTRLKPGVNVSTEKICPAAGLFIIMPKALTNRARSLNYQNRLGS